MPDRAVLPCQFNAVWGMASKGVPVVSGRVPARGGDRMSGRVGCVAVSRYSSSHIGRGHQ
ncbi:MAG: hypothetical protein KME26_05435 [Oscillatoria princeps RMCB-10]|nr:hypothetical protein [Oscillatoria princeps RMCB-10]